jgi:malic enzyme
VFDIELNFHDPQEIIKAVLLLDPTFGGINLEDIKAPECFHIEETLKRWKVLYEGSTETGETYGKDFFVRRIL